MIKVEINQTYETQAGRTIRITGQTAKGLFTSPDTGHKYYLDGTSTAIGRGSDLLWHLLMH